MDDDHILPIRLARAGEAGVPFARWLERRASDRRRKERQIVYLLQWDRLRDEQATEPSAEQYAERWGASPATSYRLLAEFRSLLPGQRSPSALLAMLWTGLRTPHANAISFGSLMEVLVMREDPPLRDVREVLPRISSARLQTAVRDRYGIDLIGEGSQYEAYEVNLDRFAWAPIVEGHPDKSWSFVSFVAEGDADGQWLLGPAEPKGHPDRASAEMASASRAAEAMGLRVRSITISMPTPVIRDAPGSRPSRRQRE